MPSPASWILKNTNYIKTSTFSKQTFKFSYIIPFPLSKLKKNQNCIIKHFWPIGVKGEEPKEFCQFRYYLNLGKLVTDSPNYVSIRLNTYRPTGIKFIGPYGL